MQAQCGNREQREYDGRVRLEIAGRRDEIIVQEPAAEQARASSRVSRRTSRLDAAPDRPALHVAHRFPGPKRRRTLATARLTRSLAAVSRIPSARPTSSKLNPRP